MSDPVIFCEGWIESFLSYLIDKSAVLYPLDGEVICLEPENLTENDKKVIKENNSVINELLTTTLDQKIEIIIEGESMSVQHLKRIYGPYTCMSIAISNKKILNGYRKHLFAKSIDLGNLINEKISVH